VEVLNAAGATVSEQKYWPYGATRSGGVAQTDKLYTGQQIEPGDAALGLYNYKARFYSTTLGRFVSADSYALDHLNRYAYVLNNPLRWNDPSGNCAPGIGDCPDTDAGGCDNALACLAGAGLTAEDIISLGPLAQAWEEWTAVWSDPLLTATPFSTSSLDWLLASIYADYRFGTRFAPGIAWDALAWVGFSSEIFGAFFYLKTGNPANLYNGGEAGKFFDWSGQKRFRGKDLDEWALFDRTLWAAGELQQHRSLGYYNWSEEQMEFLNTTNSGFDVDDGEWRDNQTERNYHRRGFYQGGGSRSLTVRCAATPNTWGCSLPDIVIPRFD
jgi:RHS repeat-associated protein